MMLRDLRGFTRGYFNRVECRDQALLVNGWMMRIDRRFDEIRIIVDGLEVGRAAPCEMTDVAKAFPWIPHAGQSGFSFERPVGVSEGLLEIIGVFEGRPMGKLRTRFSARSTPFDLPPIPLMLRVSGSDNPDFFRADGQRTYADFAAAVERHRGFERVRRMLDWGCGSGRVTAHFLADGRIPEVFGTDIDGEAIAWCQNELQGGRFQKSDAFPPLPFPDAAMDLVVAYSVFSHLDRDLQRQWLCELRRVLVPGGILLASVHGEFAALFNLPRRVPRNRLESVAIGMGLMSSMESDILDSIPDHALDGIAPNGYYRGVFQKRKYTVENWGTIMHVAEYIPAGIGNYQDLVVLQNQSPDQ